MTRKMYDSINPDAIPVDAQMVAGYIDGSTYRWPESAWSRFPHSVKVRIARRTFTNDGHVLDVESGIPTVWPPSQAIVDWVNMRRKAGVEPTIYCNQLNDWPGIRTLFQNAGVREPQYWVARYNNIPTIPTGAVAKQYANAPLAGGNYDLSAVADYWPGVDGNESIGGDELDMTPLEVQNAVYAAVTNLAIDAASGNEAAKMAQAWRASMRAVLSIDQLTDDEANLITEIRKQGAAVITTEQLQELKDAIKEAQTDEQADAVVNAFYRRLAPTS